MKDNKLKKILIRMFKCMFVGGPGYGTADAGPGMSSRCKCKCNRDYMRGAGPF